MLDIIGALEETAARREADRGQAGPSDAIAQLTSQIIRCAATGADNLQRSLQEGLKEAARRLDHVSLAVTGLAWLGAGAPSVEQEMIALVKGARREMALCAYAITPGAMSFLTELREVVAQGVSATLVVNGFTGQPLGVQAFLKECARSNDRWRLYDFPLLGAHTELHAKVLVVDRSVALIGSANFSFHGMVSNHEMAVVVRGPTAEAISARIEMLTQGARVKRVAV
jgi:cardiolipin synthase